MLINKSDINCSFFSQRAAAKNVKMKRSDDSDVESVSDNEFDQFLDDFEVGLTGREEADFTGYAYIMGCITYFCKLLVLYGEMPVDPH